MAGQKPAPHPLWEYDRQTESGQAPSGDFGSFNVRFQRKHDREPGAPSE